MSDVLLYNIFDSAVECTNAIISAKLAEITGLQFAGGPCDHADTCAVECDKTKYESASGNITCTDGLAASGVTECVLKSKLLK